jgi:hypothetical protein
MAPDSVEMGNCKLCRKMRRTTYASFYYNVGMLVRRETHSVAGYLCRSCVHRNFWEYTGKNLLLGWWGTISLLVTPGYFVSNVYSYLRALYLLRGSLE